MTWNASRRGTSRARRQVNKVCNATLLPLSRSTVALAFLVVFASQCHFFDLNLQSRQFGLRGSVVRISLSDINADQKFPCHKDFPQEIDDDKQSCHDAQQGRCTENG